MTNANGGPPTGHGLDGFYDTLRRPGIVRPAQGRWFAGVATSIARWLGVDPLIVRAGFILFGIFFGMGVALYLLLWLLLPDERGDLRIERALRDGDGGSIFLLVVTAMSVLGGGPWWDDHTSGMRVGSFVLLGVLVWWFLTRTDAGRHLAGPRAAGPPAGPAGMSTGNAAAQAGAAQAGAAQAGASTWTAPTAPPVGAVRPAPPRPRERTRVIGLPAGMLVLGAALLAGATMTSLAGSGGWQGSHLAVGIATGLGVLGLGMVAAGLAGRRSGGLAPLAVIGIVAALFTTSVPAGLTRPWQVGDRSHVVTSLAAVDAYQLGMGELTVDLSGADWKSTSGTDRVTATVGLGQLNVVVPDGVRVTVHARGRAGELLALGSNEGSDQVSGSSGPQPRFRQGGTAWDETVTYGSPGAREEIVVDAEIGLGQVAVRTGHAS
ncbi:MAG TPA: PspC domain-containing protein [Intrasporangium sp.]|uniref:PspC domain-containing protein n=1 Tax=Intrasporangium sp. TaxID=1925024 RepID=UPI002D7998E1|nr:PspC domain-containing protein [Intrasporangium sp.]HET7400044.1 PspC domain-containing protein [Intrasporangium sp.]